MVQQRLRMDVLLPGRVECVRFRLQLRLQSTQYLKVASHLSRKFSNMLPLEFANLLFLCFQALPSSLQLALEKSSIVLGLLLSHFQVLIDEKIRQLACDLLSDQPIERLNNER